MKTRSIFLLIVSVLITANLAAQNNYVCPSRYRIQVFEGLNLRYDFKDVVLGNDPAGNTVVGGPAPWYDVTNAVHAGGASASAQTTTGSISKNSKTLDLVAAQDFRNGQGIAVFGAGPPPTIATPTGLAVAAQGTDLPRK